MLNLKEGVNAVKYAREVVEQYVKNNTTPSNDLAYIFSEKHS